MRHDVMVRQKHMLLILPCASRIPQTGCLQIERLGQALDAPAQAAGGHGGGRAHLGSDQLGGIPHPQLVSAAVG